MPANTADFPGRPKILKGALVVFDTLAPVPTNVIVFQFNPETMSRSFERQYEEGDVSSYLAGDSGRVLPPTETFQVTIDLDAADQLERSDSTTLAVGLHPALAALELLVYPNSTLVGLARILASAGSAMVSPAQVPVVLLVWGKARVVPVRVNTVSITELAFDQGLNPIAARVELSLRSLTQAELADAGAPFEALGVTQILAKEVLARRGALAGAAQIVRDLLPF